MFSFKLLLGYDKSKKVHVFNQLEGFKCLGCCVIPLSFIRSSQIFPGINFLLNRLSPVSVTTFELFIPCVDKTFLFSSSHTYKKENASLFHDTSVKCHRKNKHNLFFLQNNNKNLF